MLLLGQDTWVFSSPIAQRLEVVDVGFLIQVTKLKAKRLKEGLWWKVAAKKVLQGAGTQPLHTHLYRRQATVVEWVALPPIFKVCARDTGYEGWGKLQEPWWRQATAEKTAEGSVRRYFGGGKELAATGIQQAWRRRGRG